MDDIFKKWELKTDTQLPLTFIDIEKKSYSQNTIDVFLKYYMSSDIMACFDSVQQLMHKIIEGEVENYKSKIREKEDTINKQIPYIKITEIMNILNNISEKLSINKEGLKV